MVLHGPFNPFSFQLIEGFLLKQFFWINNVFCSKKAFRKSSIPIHALGFEMQVIELNVPLSAFYLNETHPDKNNSLK